MLEAVLGMLVGAFLIVRVEELRKPVLKLRLLPSHTAPYPEGRPAKVGYVVTLAVSNEVLPWWGRWMSRSAAEQCRADISFHHMDGQDVFGRSMVAKWVRTPEATPLPIHRPHGELLGVLVDSERIFREPRIDIAPGESSNLDVAVRFDDESECYGWNMDSYRFGWRNPNWRLDPGRYLVCVRVFSGDQSCTGLFRLLNDVPTNAFRLEPAIASDRVR